MKVCGYHLRCLNYGDYCSECTHHNENKVKDYLIDVFNVWPKGKEAILKSESIFS